jgi:hypothetical protein
MTPPEAPMGHRRVIVVCPSGSQIRCACGWGTTEFVPPDDAEAQYDAHLVGAPPVSLEQQEFFELAIRAALAEMPTDTVAGVFGL